MEQSTEEKRAGAADGANTAPAMRLRVLLFLTVGRTPAVALAGVLAGAGMLLRHPGRRGFVVLRSVGGAPTLAFARILSGAGVFFRYRFRTLRTLGGLSAVLGSCVEARSGSAQQTGQSCGNDQRFFRGFH